MTSPYREIEKRDLYGSIRVGPIEIKEIPWRKHASGVAVRIERDIAFDRWGPDRVSVWNLQRNGVASVNVNPQVVLSRDQWNAYKAAVDELFDAWETSDAAERSR